MDSQAFGAQEPRVIVIPTSLSAAKVVEKQIMGEILGRDYDEQAMFAIKLALEEALTNAIRHGNRLNPACKVTVRYHVDGRNVVIQIEDEGRGFDPNQVPDPTADENLERPYGRGIMLIRAYMDKVSYNKRGNRLQMIKYRAPEAAGVS